MFDSKAYYLLATNVATNDLVGFSHFRFDYDQDCEVIYWFLLFFQKKNFFLLNIYIYIYIYIVMNFKLNQI
jgi:hypothetical protein